MELINLTQQQIGAATVQTVNARDLHAFLESKQDYSAWIKDRLAGYEEGKDYVIGSLFYSKIREYSTRGKPKIEYFLSLDTGKELAMLERNEKGREARKYFIAAEKQLREVLAAPVAPATRDKLRFDYPVLNVALDMQYQATSNGEATPKHVYITNTSQLNAIVTGKHGGCDRDNLSDADGRLLMALQSKCLGLVLQGLQLKERKLALIEFAASFRAKQAEAQAKLERKLAREAKRLQHLQ